MTDIFLGIGSNIDKERTIAIALDKLEQQFQNIAISPTFESEAVGFIGDNFFNLVAKVESDKRLDEIITCCKKIEDDCGRDRSTPRFSARNIDIDVLLFGQQISQQPIELPRGEVIENAYVLWPLAILAPDLVHPTEQKTISQLWQAFEHNQKLWQVAIDYNVYLTD